MKDLSAEKQFQEWMETGRTETVRPEVRQKGRLEGKEKESLEWRES